jgi:hypothetical protein
MSYFLRQIGDCIWIIGHMPVGEGQPPFLSAFHGRFGTDFRIVGSFSDTTGVLVPGYDMGVLAFRITFEGDEVILVEDRTDSGPPGCTGGPGACPAVRELRRAH